MDIGYLRLIVSDLDIIKTGFPQENYLQGNAGVRLKPDSDLKIYCNFYYGTAGFC